MQQSQTPRALRARQGHERTPKHHAEEKLSHIDIHMRGVVVAVRRDNAKHIQGHVLSRGSADMHTYTAPSADPAPPHLGLKAPAEAPCPRNTHPAQPLDALHGGLPLQILWQSQEGQAAVVYTDRITRKHRRRVQLPLQLSAHNSSFAHRSGRCEGSWTGPAGSELC